MTHHWFARQRLARSPLPAPVVAAEPGICKSWAVLSLALGDGANTDILQTASTRVRIFRTLGEETPKRSPKLGGRRTVAPGARAVQRPPHQLTNPHWETSTRSAEGVHRRLFAWRRRLRSRRGRRGAHAPGLWVSGGDDFFKG